MVAINPWGSWLRGSSATQALAVVHHLTLPLLSGINMSDCQADFNPYLATEASRLWKWWKCLKNVFVKKADTFFSVGDVICLRSYLPGRVVSVYWGKNVECHVFSGRCYLYSLFWVNGFLNSGFNIGML